MRVVVLTGAGISAESGVPTFRDARGLWEGHRVEDVASPEAFQRQPDLVHRFYDERRAALTRVQPNAAHRALACLEQQLGSRMLVVTQNIDDLHERAGSRRVLHMHGKLRSARCTACGTRLDWREDLAHRPACPRCGERALRPDVVWFGESTLGMGQVESALSRADLFVSVGTSGMVYPAAGFVRIARLFGARTLELNLERTPGSELFDEARHGPAGSLVRAWVQDLLARRPAEVEVTRE
ncbi:MAG TPA: NAD-dependent deacylase [Nocardioides sp.]|uniref:NAD-dependent deacylase n=1 Tax=Nocardioides sp. TaxID=35761 RepID=UPI002C9F7754|nr:NAD-dependent deacylase [Nocardioides sp.]HQR26789.1 NAD-dependent deacylase [Nocardioides sp.]